MVSLFGCREEDLNEDFSIALITWDQSFTSELFKDISGDNIIDLEMQDHVLITPGIFPYTYHVGSNFSIPSILSNGLIPGGQELNGRQSV